MAKTVARAYWDTSTLREAKSEQEKNDAVKAMADAIMKWAQSSVLFDIKCHECGKIACYNRSDAVEKDGWWVTCIRCKNPIEVML